jgi:periplasmic protein TonB
MFENSLVESRIVPVSSSKRWTAVASISLQFAIAAAVITLPLLHPEGLPFHADSPRVLMPLLPKAPAPVVRVEQASSASASLSVPDTARPMIMPTLLHDRNIPTSEAPPLAASGRGMASPDGLLSMVGSSLGEGGPHVSVAPARAPIGPVHVSTGVLQGMLIAPIRPIYPNIARAAHVEGTVVVEAIISRTGTIESLHAVSGSPMLRGAAIEAIRAARYRPFELNGEPTEVQTTITVNFRMTE